jgi:hypothetical protein
LQQPLIETRWLSLSKPVLLAELVEPGSAG